jgi:hypothetical protein
MKITRSSLTKLPPPGNARRTYWDDELPGFGITQHSSGKIAFVAKFRVAGKQVMKTLGSYPALTPEQAKTLFGQFKAHAALGQDLSEKIRQERRAGTTMNDLCDAYEVRYLPLKRAQSAYPGKFSAGWREWYRALI